MVLSRLRKIFAGDNNNFMVYFAPLFLIIIAYLLGSLVQAVLRDKNSKLPETILVGTLVMLLLWEAVILPSIKLLASFRGVCKVYSGLLLLLVLISVIVAGRRMTGQHKITRIYDVWPLAGALGVMVLQIIFIFMLVPNLYRDYTIETVNTTLVSDLIYENHPGLGTTFEYGITFRGKLVTLPLFYAYLVQIFGEAAATMVFRVVPIWMLLLNAFAYWNLGNHIFKKDESEWNRSFIFVIGIGLLNIFGSFAKNCIFYYQMHRGFRGETMIYGILLPFSLCLCSRIFVQRDYVKVVYLLLILLASIAVTDYQKGFIPILLSVIICLLLSVISKVRRWIRCRK